MHPAKQAPGTDQEKTAPFPLIEGKSENRQRDEALESQLPEKKKKSLKKDAVDKLADIFFLKVVFMKLIL